jgi:hypothetical protein
MRLARIQASQKIKLQPSTEVPEAFAICAFSSAYEDEKEWGEREF